MTSDLLIAARDLGARGSRAMTGDADPAGALPDAAVAVLAAVPSWWEARAAAAGLSGRWLDVTTAVDAEAPAAALVGGSPPTITPSVSAEVLGAAYVEALSREVRARHGRHYTPPHLAEQLWEMTRTALGFTRRDTRLTGLVRDRACGAAGLLLPPLREHLRASSHTDAQLVFAALPALIEGVDADPNAVWLANVVLAAEALPLLAAIPPAQRRPMPALASCGDGLAELPRPAHVEVQNPPYGRVRLDVAERRRWGHVLYGHANLYGLFIAAGLSQLDNDGVLGALVPTSFTSGLYFSRLREVLSQEAPLRAAAFVAERDGVFAGVLQETCLAVFAKRRVPKSSIARLNGHVEPVTEVQTPRGMGPWLLPRRVEDAPTAAAATRLPLVLADLGYRCSTGPLVWNRRAKDLSAEEAPGHVRVLWGADIDGGVVHRDSARDAMRFLALRAGDEPALVLKGPAILVQRTTAPEQARRLVAAELSEQVLAGWGGRLVVENHVNVVRPVTSKPLLGLGTLASVLATDTLDRVMRSLSGSVAVSAYEIAAIPFPGAETLSTWNGLRGDELTRAVSAAYAGAG